MQRAFGGVRCKTKDCPGLILRRYLGLYDPKRITIPEEDEETFKERCFVCQQEHQYKLENAIVIVAYHVLPG